MDFADIFMIWFVIVLPCVVNTETLKCQKQISPCSCETMDGKTIDLTPLSTKPAPRFTQTISDGYEYQWDPCRTFKCDKYDVAACQKSTYSSQNVYALGDLNTTRFGSDSNGLFLQYTTAPGEGGRSCRVNLQCNPNATAPVFAVKGVDTPGGMSFTMGLVAKEVCPIEKPNSGGMSIGDILLLVFFLLLIVYIVVGILVNYFVRHERGMELIPNRTFWFGLPGLIKDGFMFVVNTIRRKPADTYEKV